MSFRLAGWIFKYFLRKFEILFSTKRIHINWNDYNRSTIPYFIFSANTRILPKLGFGFISEIFIKYGTIGFN